MNQLAVFLQHLKTKSRYRNEKQVDSCYILLFELDRVAPLVINPPSRHGKCCGRYKRVTVNLSWVRETFSGSYIIFHEN